MIDSLFPVLIPLIDSFLWFLVMVPPPGPSFLVAFLTLPLPPLGPQLLLSPIKLFCHAHGTTMVTGRPLRDICYTF